MKKRSEKRTTLISYDGNGWIEEKQQFPAGAAVKASDRRTRNNAAGFHANFSDSDIDNVSHFIDYFFAARYRSPAAHQFVAHGMEERGRNKGDAPLSTRRTRIHRDVDDLRREAKYRWLYR